jgi:hypothetical protein
MTRVASVTLISLLLACGSTQKPPPGDGDGDGPDPTGPSGEDQAFNKYPAETMEGIVFVPQALGIPGMWNVTPQKKTTLAASRKLIAKQDASIVDLQVFAGLAWAESNKAGKKEADVKQLRTEARDALRRAWAAAKGEPGDEITLKLLSVAEMTLGDTDAGAKAYALIIEKFPGEDKALNARTWLANIHLLAGRNAEAATLVEGWTVDAKLDPMAAYVLGWVKFRQRDYATARAAIAHAAKVWNTANRKVVGGDVILFNARAGAPFGEVDAMFKDLAAGDAESHFSLDYSLMKGYDLAGHFDQAIAAAEGLLAGKAKPLQPIEEVVLRADLAYLYFRTGDPGKTAELAKGSHDKLVACGEACTKDPRTKQIVEGIKAYATSMHTLYAHSLDERYYTPAKALYDYYMGIAGAPDIEVLRGYLTRLEETHKNADPKAGRHDEGEMGKQLKLKFNAVKACYESVLQWEPTLAGDVKLGLVIKEDGSVTSAPVEPPKGQQGMAAVAGCLQDRALKWKFPGRTVAGQTGLEQKFSFKPAAPK